LVSDAFDVAVAFAVAVAFDTIVDVSVDDDGLLFDH
jgi:hypothetical protein